MTDDYWNDDDRDHAFKLGWTIHRDGQFERRRYSAPFNPEELLADITAKAAAGGEFHQRALAEAMHRRMTK